MGRPKSSDKPSAAAAADKPAASAGAPTDKPAAAGDSATAQVTDPAADPATAQVTDPAADPATAQVTDPAADPATAQVTDPAADPATAEASDPPPAADAPRAELDREQPYGIITTGPAAFAQDGRMFDHAGREVTQAEFEAWEASLRA